MHPAEKYCSDILSGKIVACEWVKLACQRQANDLNRVGTDPKFKWSFSKARAQRVIDFFKYCRHTEGEWAGQPIVLSPADQFMVWVVYGWIDSEGQRRFREVYEEKGRKNAKTTKLAGLGNYHLDADGEQGARVFCAATKLEQARLLHEAATNMVRRSPSLRKRIKINKDNLHVLDSYSKFEPLAGDSETLDGLNISAGFLDELHAHLTGELKDIIETAMGSRRQPLLWSITTAGKRREGVCWETRQYAIETLKASAKGIECDETFAAFIYCIDEGDDIFDESVWVKANPNLNISVKIEDMRRLAYKAKSSGRARAAFMRLRLGVWTGESDKAISELAWKACAAPVNIALLRKKKARCWVGFDLSSRVDLTALVQFFPNRGGFDIVPTFWIPEDSISEREIANKDLILQWVKAGYIKTTPGNIVRYKFVRREIREIAKHYRIQDIAGDAWNATQFMTQLEDDGFNVWAIPQTIRALAHPTKEFEGMVIDKRLRHGGHPVLEWNAMNLAWKEDESGNIRPSKKRSSGKIDGIMAMINCIARWLDRNNTDGPRNDPNRQSGFKLETI